MSARGLAFVALLAGSGCRPETLWYVDHIEGAHAVLIGPTGEARVVSTQVLPPDAGEGSWFQGGRRLPAVELSRVTRIAARRRALAASDDGRDVSLER